MGWLKKITRPISKVLDKIIPNEIKPALPYLSAFAPLMMGPTGIMGSSMLRRALMSGALNLGSQLSQEGSEGEFNPLSVLLAGSTGAMTSPDAPGFFEGMQKGPTGADRFLDPTTKKMIEIPYSDQSGIMSSVKDAIGKGGETASKFLMKQGDILRPGGEELTMKNALAATSVPVTHATADTAMILANQALDEYNAGLEEGSDAWYDDNARRVAITSAMEAGGHTAEAIEDALASLGLKDGGRVGRAGGGMMTVLPKGAEMDYRGGGMIPMGSKERADDVPARLSKNEFVMTADAVKAAGGGSVNRGAKRMYDLMHNLEARV